MSPPAHIQENEKENKGLSSKIPSKREMIQHGQTGQVDIKGR